jgi:hypothetical protein
MGPGHKQPFRGSGIVAGLPRYRWLVGGLTVVGMGEAGDDLPAVRR